LSGVLDGVTVTPPEAVRLETVYYDTPDLRLARWGVSLRHRAGEGWTLKLPPAQAPGQPQGQLLERDEITFQGGAKRPPEGAVAIVRAYVRKAELVPVARLSTIRRRVRLIDAAGTRVAEVVDDEVSVRDGRRVAARFREIEVEVMPQQNGAAGSIADPLVMRLRGAGAGAADPTPKHIRALGPRAMEPPEVSAQPVLPGAPGREVIKHVLAESIASLLKHDPLVRTSGDPEAVHQARVATRKLRSNLRTFGPLLDPDWTEPLRSDLGWLALGLGAVRDREVLFERLSERAKSLPASDLRSAGSLLHILEVEITTLRAKLMGELDSPRYVDLLERLVLASSAPATLPDADQPASAVLPPLSAGPWRRLRSAVALPDRPTRSCTEYASSPSGRAMPPRSHRRQRRFARRPSSRRSQHQDSVTAQVAARADQWSRRGGLREHIAAEDARAKWPKVWQALDRKTLRDWMP
jgi:inorganic triphosphatase YgiF